MHMHAHVVGVLLCTYSQSMLKLYFSYRLECNSTNSLKNSKTDNTEHMSTRDDNMLLCYLFSFKVGEGATCEHKQPFLPVLDPSTLLH